MDKEENNHLAVFERIYHTNTIREKEEDRIYWRSKYLESLQQVVYQTRDESTGWLDNLDFKLNLFNSNSTKLKKSPLLHFLATLLKKGLQ
ncbi:MAG: hypothetical protein ACQERJ_03145 [Bacillota bacterium]